MTADPRRSNPATPFTSTTLFGPISSGLAGRLWRPDPANPVLAEWWRALAELGRRLRAEEFPWPIHRDDYHLVGRVDRSPRPRVWVYRHHRGPAELAVDDDGRTYRFFWSRDRRSLGRLKEVDNRGAFHRAGLTDLVECGGTLSYAYVVTDT
jgi:hypothetical protein